jgi:hypothetical protein
LREPPSGKANGLTGKSSGQNVNRSHVVGVKLSDVSVDRDAEAVGEHVSAEAVDLALPDRFVADAFECKVNTPDAREE